MTSQIFCHRVNTQLLMNCSLHWRECISKGHNKPEQEQSVDDESKKLVLIHDFHVYESQSRMWAAKDQCVIKPKSLGAGLIW